MRCRRQFRCVGRSLFRPKVTTLAVVATAIFLSSCAQTSTTSEPDLFKVPPLTQRVTFEGLSIRVPSTFQVTPFHGCFPRAGVVQVGIPTEVPIDCPPAADRFSGTAISFTTLQSIDEDNGSWPENKRVGAIAISESGPEIQVACAVKPCLDIGQLFARVLSYGVGVVITAEGNPSDEVLKLGTAIINTLAPISS